MELTTALYVLGTLLAILAAIPPLRAFYLLNIGVVLIDIGLVLSVGAVKV